MSASSAALPICADDGPAPSAPSASHLRSALGYLAPNGPFNTPILREEMLPQRGPDGYWLYERLTVLVQHAGREAVAATVGVADKRLEAWERNLNHIPSLYIAPPADALGVSAHYLLTGAESQHVVCPACGSPMRRRVA